MKCFESFFKHTWQPQQVHQLHQMDHSSRFEPTKTTEMPQAGETELGEIKVMTPTSSVATSMRISDNIPCKNGSCKVWRSRNSSRFENPWHSLKTIFLVSAIVAFLLWIIIYALLDRYQIL